jgi:hypothetical protein
LDVTVFELIGLRVDARLSGDKNEAVGNDSLGIDAFG